MSALEKDFLDWIYQTAKATVRANEALKVFAGPDVSQADFRRQCSEAAQDGRDKELITLAASFDKKIDVLADKLAREEGSCLPTRQSCPAARWRNIVPMQRPC